MPIVAGVGSPRSDATKHVRRSLAPLNVEAFTLHFRQELTMCSLCPPSLLCDGLMRIITDPLAALDCAALESLAEKTGTRTGWRYSGWMSVLSDQTPEVLSTCGAPRRLQGQQHQRFGCTAALWTVAGLK